MRAVDSPEVIVVGLGAFGAATTFQLAKRGLTVLGLDQFRPPHDQGSSHGETRITRLAIGEGDEYVPLAVRSHQLWREIEAQSGRRLMFATGGLVLGDPDLGGFHHGKEDFVARTISAAQRFGVEHEVLSSAEVKARFPVFSPTPHEIGYYEPAAGVLVPERCIQIQLRLARAHGARLLLGERVLGVDPGPGAVRVRTKSGDFSARRVVIAAGAWTGGLLGGAYRERLTLHRQTLHWFTPRDRGPYRAGHFPVFIWLHGSGPRDLFYGFPLSPAGRGLGVKLAEEQFEISTAAPEALETAVGAEESEALYAHHAAARLVGLRRPATRAAACLYTTAPDSRFIVETHPESDRIHVISACSGHGFKHSAAIGEAVAEWIATGAAPPVLLPFGASRERSSEAAPVLAS
ncbi:MAG TPA: N-methyl-L-tryptophan oxidase [Caulobacteraceae bacterium]